MFKSKRFNGSMAAVVVLAVILTIAVTAGATMAWFSSNDYANKKLTLGDEVLVQIADEDTTISGGELDLVIPAEYLVPGMQIFPTVYANIKASNTSALLRAKVDITVEGVTGAEKTKIEESLQGSFEAKANGWYYDDGSKYFYFVGNGAAYSKQMLTPAKTTVIGSSASTEYATYGRAGTLLQESNDMKDTNFDTYAAFTDKNITEEGPTKGQAVDSQLLTGENKAQLASIVTLAKDAEGKYYVGGSETAVYEAGNVARVPFLVRPILIPTTWGNEVKNTDITIKITFEAIQDYLIDPDSLSSDRIVVVVPTLENAIKVFASAKAQADDAATGD